MGSIHKGKRGELDLVNWLKSLGHEARRTQQYCGNTGDASDIVCELLKDYHIECKRTEAVNLYKAFEQAVRDSEPKVGYSMFGPDGLPRKTPIVFHRKNRSGWMVFMEAEKFIELVSELARVRQSRAE